MSQLIKTLLVSLVFVSGSFASAKPQRRPASSVDLIDFLPAGYYRKVSAENAKCPDGRFQWLENNTMLSIGGARPLQFHSFNSSHTEKVSVQAVNCVAVTTNKVTDTSKGKTAGRTVAQIIENKCGNSAKTEKYTLVASKMKDKTLVDIKIEVNHTAPKQESEPVVHCAYETGPIK